MSDETPPGDQNKTLHLWEGQGGEHAAGWEAIHKAGIYHAGTKAGASPAEVILNLDLARYIQGAPIKVMEVGVGSGLMTRYLLELGHDVIAVDISPTALAGLPDEVTKILTDAVVGLGTDLIISYQTFQHIPDMELQGLLYDLRLALNPGGVMCFQYAGPTDVSLPLWIQRDLEAGFVFLRTPEQMGDLLKAGGWQIMEERGLIPIPSIRWGLVKCQAGS